MQLQASMVQPQLNASRALSHLLAPAGPGIHAPDLVTLTQVLVPTAVRQAKRGKMKYIIGNGANKWDMTYVGNVAQAHVLVSGWRVGGWSGGARW